MRHASYGTNGWLVFTQRFRASLSSNGSYACVLLIRHSNSTTNGTG